MQLKKYTSIWKKWLFFNKKSTISGLLLLGVLLIMLPATRIKNIHCYCDGQVCEESICQTVQKQIGKNLLTLNKKVLEKKLNPGGKYKKLAIGFSHPNTVTVNFHTSADFFIFNSTITNEKINLSSDSPPVASDSAVFFNKPSLEISDWIKTAQLVSLKIFPSGLYETVSTSSSQIFAITSDKKEAEWYQAAYKLIKIVLTYADVSGIYFLDNNVYFAQMGQPDVIVSMDYNQVKLTKSLQSVRFLTTIKKDPKIIDLRYSNPIIR